MSDQRPTSSWSHLVEPSAPPPDPPPRWWLRGAAAAALAVGVAVVLSLVLGVLGSLRLPWAAGSLDAAVLRRVAETPQGIWLVPEEHGVDTVAAHVERVAVAAEDAEAVPVLVLYGIPDRDCAAGFSAGGLPAADYLPWVEQVVRGLDGADRAAVVLEPDALLAALECGDGTERLRLLEEAVGLLADSDATAYVDAGHFDWQAPGVVADLLRDVGVARVRGFATNVANSQREPDERAYADEVASLLGEAGSRYVIDTGRSGAGPGADFCNPVGVAPGTAPGAVEDGSGLDARLWVAVNTDRACRRRGQPAGRPDVGGDGPAHLAVDVRPPGAQQGGPGADVVGLVNDVAQGPGWKRARTARRAPPCSGPQQVLRVERR